MNGLPPSRAQRLDARGEHRIVGRRERQLVDHHHRQRLAAHVHAFPERLARRAAPRCPARGSAPAARCASRCPAPAADSRSPSRSSSSCARRSARSVVNSRKARPPLAAQHRQRRLDHRVGVRRVVRIRGQAPAARRAAPGARSRTGSPSARAAASSMPSSRVKWREILAHRQRRRGEDPGARMVRPSGVRNSSAGDSGVTCSCSDWPNTSTQRTSLVAASPSRMRASSARSVAPRGARRTRQALGALGLLVQRLAQRLQRVPSACSASAKPGIAQRLRPARGAPAFAERTGAGRAPPCRSWSASALELGRGAAGGAQLERARRARARPAARWTRSRRRTGARSRAAGAPRRRSRCCTPAAARRCPRRAAPRRRRTGGG